jgi:hypothetical protein
LNVTSIGKRSRGVEDAQPAPGGEDNKAKQQKNIERDATPDLLLKH